MSKPSFVKGTEYLNEAYDAHGAYVDGLETWLDFQEKNGEKIFLYNIIQDILEMTQSDEMGDEFPSKEDITEQRDDDKYNAFGKKLDRNNAKREQAGKKVADISEAITGGDDRTMQGWEPDTEKDGEDETWKTWFRASKDGESAASWAEEFRGLTYKQQVEYLAEITGLLHHTERGKSLLADLADPEYPPLHPQHLFTPPKEEKAKPEQYKTSDDGNRWGVTESLVAHPSDGHNVAFKHSENLGRWMLAKNNAVGRNLVRIGYNLLPGVVRLYTRADAAGDQDGKRRARRIYGMITGRVVPIKNEIFMKLITEGDKSALADTRQLVDLIAQSDDVLEAVYSGNRPVIAAKNTAFSGLSMLAGALAITSLIISPEDDAFDQVTKFTASVAQITQGLGDLSEVASSYTKFSKKSSLISAADYCGALADVIGTAYAVKDGILAYDRGREYQAWGNTFGAISGMASFVGFLGGFSLATGVGIAFGALAAATLLFLSDPMSRVTEWVRHTYFGQKYGSKIGADDSWTSGLVFDDHYGYAFGRKSNRDHNFLRQVGGYFELEYPMGLYNGYPTFASAERETKPHPDSTLSGKITAGHLVIPKLGGGGGRSKIIVRRMELGAGPPGTDAWITDIHDKLYEFELPFEDGGTHVDHKSVGPKQFEDIDCTVYAPNGLGGSESSPTSKHTGINKLERNLDGNVNNFVLRLESNDSKDLSGVWGFDKTDYDTNEEYYGPGLIVRHIPPKLDRKIEKLTSTGPLSQAGLKQINRMAPTAYMPIRDNCTTDGSEFRWRDD